MYWVSCNNARNYSNILVGYILLCYLISLYNYWITVQVVQVKTVTCLFEYTRLYFKWKKQGIKIYLCLKLLLYYPEAQVQYQWSFKYCDYVQNVQCFQSITFKQYFKVIKLALNWWTIQFSIICFSEFNLIDFK